MKYKISREFFPFNHFTPPISERFLSISVPFMRVPRSIYRRGDVAVDRHFARSHDGAQVECLLISPRGAEGALPCLIYIHGGGFVLPAAGYHYKNAIRYSREVGCRVLFVNYRLAPAHPHPTFFEDCYAAMCYAYDNADVLGIDRSRIGIGGDSAGAALSVGVCLMARDRAHPIRFACQMLPYPFLDARNDSASARKYTDTPMWNSTLTGRIAPMTRADRDRPDYVYYSPLEAPSLADLPPAYIETAELDPLHDDGISYAARLSALGIEVTLNETHGTMHGFDIVQSSKITRAALERRIEFLRRYLSRADKPTGHARPMPTTPNGGYYDNRLL